MVAESYRCRFPTVFIVYLLAISAVSFARQHHYDSYGETVLKTAKYACPETTTNTESTVVLAHIIKTSVEETAVTAHFQVLEILRKVASDEGVFADNDLFDVTGVLTSEFTSKCHIPVNETVVLHLDNRLVVTRVAMPTIEQGKFKI